MKKVFLISMILFFGLKNSISQSIILDSAFGNNGIVNEGSNEIYYRGMAIQTDSKAVVVAAVYGNGLYNSRVARFNVNGTFDSTFSDDGKQMIAFGSEDADVRDVALQGDGKIVILGNSGGSFVIA